MHALLPDVSSLIDQTEFFLFKAALFVVFVAGLYRLVRREVGRDD